MEKLFGNSNKNFAGENRLCFFENYERKPATPVEKAEEKENPKPNNKGKEKRNKESQEVTETLRPKNLTKKDAQIILEMTENRDEYTERNNVGDTKDSLKPPRLNLDGFTYVDEEAMSVISEYNGEEISLNGLKELDTQTAKKLAKFDGKKVYLNGLQKLDVDTAYALREFECEELFLNGVEQLDPLSPPSLRLVGDTISRGLAQFKGKKIYLRGVKEVDKDTLKRLSGFEGIIVSPAIAYTNRAEAYQYGALVGGKKDYKDLLDKNNVKPIKDSAYEEFIDRGKRGLNQIFAEEYFQEYLIQAFEYKNYDFNGTGSSEQKSREKFATEALFICKKLKKNPISIIWKEIFPEGSNINFTGGKITADEANENLRVLDRVETWINENL